MYCLFNTTCCLCFISWNQLPVSLFCLLYWVFRPNKTLSPTHHRALKQQPETPPKTTQNREKEHRYLWNQCYIITQRYPATITAFLPNMKFTEVFYAKLPIWDSIDESKRLANFAKSRTERPIGELSGSNEDIRDTGSMVSYQLFPRPSSATFRPNRAVVQFTDDARQFH